MEPVWSTKSKWPCCHTSTSGFLKNGGSLARDCNTHGSQESNIFPIAVFLVIESIYRSLYTLWPAVTGTKRAIYFTHLPFGSGSYFQGGKVVTYVLRTTNTSISDLIFSFSVFFCSSGAVTRMFAMFRSIAPFLAIRVREPSSTSRSITLAEEVSFPIVR